MKDIRQIKFCRYFFEAKNEFFHAGDSLREVRGTRFAEGKQPQPAAAAPPARPGLVPPRLPL